MLISDLPLPAATVTARFNPREDTHMENQDPMTISTYTTEEVTASDRKLVAQSQLLPGSGIETTVFGEDDFGSNERPRKFS